MMMGNFILDAEFFAFQFGEAKIVRVGPMIFFVNSPFEGGMLRMQ
jgi:hypothetical protein